MAPVRLLCARALFVAAAAALPVTACSIDTESSDDTTSGTLDETESPTTDTADQSNDRDSEDTGDSDTGDSDTGNSDTQAGSWAQIPELVDQVQPSIVAIAVTAGGRPGQGSGVIIDSDGLVVTNAHVVADSSDVEVILADGSRLEGEVVATDRITDLALVRVDRDGLPEATLADTYPEVGELVVAVGNPLGFDNTATAGIVSGVQRSIPGAAASGSQALVDLIQTDAAISPGNSGGALVTADGLVIGITVAYIPPALGAVNIGFAIPAPTVTDVVDELLEDGTADHPYLGLQLATVSPHVAGGLGLDAERGAAVLEIAPDGPAAEADVEQGDVITAFDGEPVDSVGELLTLLRRFESGDQVTLTIRRNGETVEPEVTLASRPVSD